MAKVKIVPQEDWSVLKKYLGTSNTGLVLVPEETMGIMSDAQKTAVEAACREDYVDYNFGGEPDCYIDIVRAGDSYAMDCICEQFSEPEDDD